MLSTSDLSIGYSSKTILSNLNLELSAGSLTALLGTNGSGKSTLLRTLAGVQKPLSGKVFWNQTLLQSFSKKQIAHKMSLVLTERPASERFTVRELVSLGRYPHTGWSGSLNTKDQKAIDWSIDAISMQNYADTPIAELSDGLKQRVMIGRALAQEGKILLLDEPTAHLDLISRSEVMLLLAQVAKEWNKAVLVSTHELDLILQVADKLWLITSEGYIKTGLTESMVLNGELDKTFVRPPLFFDAEKGHFKIRSSSRQHRFTISGDATVCYWTRLALQKKGVMTKLVEDKSADIFVCKTSEKSLRWDFEGKNFYSLEEFLSSLG